MLLNIVSHFVRTKSFVIRVMVTDICFATIFQIAIPYVRLRTRFFRCTGIYDTRYIVTRRVAQVWTRWVRGSD